MEKVYDNQTEKYIRVGRKFKITSQQKELPRPLSQKFLFESNKEQFQAKNLKMTMKLILKQAYLGRVIKTLHQNLNVTCFLSNNKKLNQISHKRYSDCNNLPQGDNKCKLCKDTVEAVQHVISSCPLMSSRYYLLMQHDIVAKASYNTIIKNRNVKRSLLEEPARVFKHKNDEFQWDIPIKTSTSNTINLTWLFGIIKIAIILQSHLSIADMLCNGHLIIGDTFLWNWQNHGQTLIEKPPFWAKFIS